MMPETTEITVLRDESTYVVKGRGELDLRVAPEFETALMKGATSGHPVVVDLCDAVYVDTAILAGLAKLATTLMQKDGRLEVLVSEGSHPEYVLKTVGFEAIMQIEHICSKDLDCCTQKSGSRDS